MACKAAVTLALIGVASCNNATEPSVLEAYLAGQAVGLEITTSVTPTTINIGGQGTMTIKLHNPKTTTVRITFTSGCQVLPYISAGQNQLVYPSGGGWGCPAVMTTLTLAPGTDYIRTTTILGGAPAVGTFQGAALSSGRYVAFAEIADGMGRSNSVKFDVVK